MTEDQIRRFIREEIERAKEPPTYRGIPLPTNSPVVRELPMPPYRYQTPIPNTCVYGGGVRADEGFGGLR